MPPVRVLCTGLILPLMSNRLRLLRKSLFSRQRPFIPALATLGLISLIATLARHSSLKSFRRASTDTFKARTVMLAAMLAIVVEFGAGLSGHRLAKASVDIW